MKLFGSMSMRPKLGCPGIERLCDSNASGFGNPQKLPFPCEKNTVAPLSKYPFGKEQAPVYVPKLFGSRRPKLRAEFTFW
jgi:hypothetical protein